MIKVCKVKSCTHNEEPKEHLTMYVNRSKNSTPSSMTQRSPLSFIGMLEQMNPHDSSTSMFIFFWNVFHLFIPAKWIADLLVLKQRI